MPQVKCSWCDQETSQVCPICSRSFCLEHAGLSSEFCTECSTDEIQHKIEKTNDFVDKEGSPHEDVTVLRPVGEYYITTPGIIAKMSDQELERFYNKYSLLVRDCEASLDRFRITKAMISMEKDERGRSKLREARAYKAAPVKSAMKLASAVAQGPTDLKLAILAKLLQKQGITKEKLQELINKKREETKKCH